MKLGFIGTGKIASSVITGICGSSLKYNKILISSRNNRIAKGLKKKFKKIVIEKENQKMKGMCISSIPYDANSKDLRKMMKKMKKRSGTTAISKNKKGNEMFLVKAQIIPNGDGMSMPSMVYNEDRKVQLQVGSHNTDEHGFPKLVNAVKEKGIKGIDVGFPVPWGIKGYFNAYLHKPDDGPLKGKKLLRIFLNESFPNPGW